MRAKEELFSIAEISKTLINNFEFKKNNGEDVWWDGKFFIISDALLARFRQTYIQFDRELLKSELWYLANPKKRKRNHFKFLVNWMNRKNGF